PFRLVLTLCVCRDQLAVCLSLAFNADIWHVGAGCPRSRERTPQPPSVDRVEAAIVTLCLRGFSRENSILPVLPFSAGRALFPLRPAPRARDRLLGDDVSQDGESAVRKVSNSASGHCPDSTTPTPEHPFIFYHAEHCNGEVLTHILVDGLKALPVTNTTVGSAITARRTPAAAAGPAPLGRAA
ncbi:unnamed protein product, partial [Prorocentrum cordatum]